MLIKNILKIIFVAKSLKTLNKWYSFDSLIGFQRTLKRVDHQGKLLEQTKYNSDTLAPKAVELCWNVRPTLLQRNLSFDWRKFLVFVCLCISLTVIETVFWLRNEMKRETKKWNFSSSTEVKCFPTTKSERYSFSKAWRGKVPYFEIFSKRVHF